MEQHISKLLATSPLFAQMAEPAIAQALDAVGWRAVIYRPHDVYALAGSACTYVDIVLTGEMVAWMVAASGRQAEVVRIYAGDVIAPCYLYAADRRMPVTIETEGEVTVLRMTRASLTQLIDNHARIRHNFIGILSDIGTYLASRLRFLSLLTVREKVIAYLHAEMRRQHSLTVSLPSTRAAIAQRFAIQKFSLLRCFAQLSAEGIIRVQGRQVTILDPSRLQV